MTNLSQLVVRRSAMIEVLRHAVGKLLDCQQEEVGKRNENERIIHNIFFPMGKDDSDSKDHDIWLLNEEYQYFEHIASDKPLSSLTWLGGGNIFDADVDESLQRLFAERRFDPTGGYGNELFVKPFGALTIQGEPSEKDDSRNGIGRLSEAGAGEVVQDESLGTESRQEPLGDPLLEVQLD